jgi:hypothetical protein
VLDGDHARRRVGDERGDEEPVDGAQSAVAAAGCVEGVVVPLEPLHASDAWGKKMDGERGESGEGWVSKRQSCGYRKRFERVRLYRERILRAPFYRALVQHFQNREKLFRERF